MEVTITLRMDFGFLTCVHGVYFEIRDGLNQSANPLGILCELYSKGYVFRSSGQNMWVKLHRSVIVDESTFHINYKAKPMNVTGLFTDPSFIKQLPYCLSK